MFAGKGTGHAEYYPLSLNALVNACNQKQQRRQPVLSLLPETVTEALRSLKEMRLVRCCR